MSWGISIDDMAEAIERELTEYRDLSADELKTAVKKAGRTAKSDIAKSAPERTGAYAKSWRMKVTEESAVGIGVTVYSPSHYMLAHLLENGHAKRNGGRVAGSRHIAPAEEHAKEQLIGDIEKALKG